MSKTTLIWHQPESQEGRTEIAGTQAIQGVGPFIMDSATEQAARVAGADVLHRMAIHRHPTTGHYLVQNDDRWCISLEEAKERAQHIHDQWTRYGRRRKSRVPPST